MNKLVAFTGAGISKASGVPTFEEMGDIRDKLSRWYFNDSPEDFYKILLEMKRTTDQAEPNPAHLALAKHKIPVVTMNIDGLHRRAGSRELVEIHGNLEHVFCPECRSTYDFYVVQKSIHCQKCGELLQSNVVLYGDSLDKFYEAMELIVSARELLVVGTSFQTSTAAQMVMQAELAGVKATVINSRAEQEVPKYLEKVFA
jgi:NAD-dependent deacetylase